MAGSPGREVEYRNPLAQELLPPYQLGGASPPAASLEPLQAWAEAAAGRTPGSANAGGSARKLTYAQQAQPPPPQQQQPDNNRPNQGGTELSSGQPGGFMTGLIPSWTPTSKNDIQREMRRKRIADRQQAWLQQADEAMR